MTLEHRFITKLYLKRARAVKDWLVAHGVEEGRITHKGLGDRFPLVENIAEGNREINRRWNLR